MNDRCAAPEVLAARGPSPSASRTRPRGALRAAAWLGCLLVLGSLHGRPGAQELEFHPPPSARDERAMAVMRDLAERVLPVYQESHPERYLGSLSALQLVAGDYAAADATRQSLRARRQGSNAGRTPHAAVLYDIYAHARALEAEKQDVEAQQRRLQFELESTKDPEKIAELQAKLTEQTQKLETISTQITQTKKPGPAVGGGGGGGGANKATSGNKPPCNCTPGDPLCSCL